MISPFCLQIIIHYCVMACDFRDGDFSAPAVMEVLNGLESEGMIEKAPKNSKGQKYIGTTKARFYLDFLLKIPFPENAFKIPENPEDAAANAFDKAFDNQEETPS